MFYYFKSSIFAILGIALITLTSCDKEEKVSTFDIDEDVTIQANENGDNVINSAFFRAPECEDGDNVFFCFRADRFKDANGCAYTPPIQSGTCPWYSPIRIYEYVSCDSTDNNYLSLGIYEGQDGVGSFVVGRALGYTIYFNAPTIYQGGAGDAGIPATFTVRERIGVPPVCDGNNALVTFDVFPNEFSIDGGVTWSSTLPDTDDLPNAIGRYVDGCKILYENQLCE